MPCLTAFSTSGCRRSGGTATSSVDASMSSDTVSRSPKRTRLDGEVAVRERELLAEGNRGALREAERRPQEVREEHAHRARFLRPLGDESARWSSGC